MRWVVKSKRYHHGCFFVIIEGVPFIVEAAMFQRSRLKKLENWAEERKGYIIAVQEKEVELKKILAELDKPYDNAAALSLITLRITSKWRGHTGSFAENKDFCFELLARVLGLPNAHMAIITDFGIE